MQTNESVNMVKCIINGQWEIMLPEHRANRQEWYTPEGWEKKRLQAMYEHIDKGDIVYYVGAEEGDMAALCQIWGGKLVLFEPNRKVVPNIKAIWDANKLEYPLYYAGFAGRNSSLNYKEGIVDFETITGEVIANHGFKELHEPFDEKGEIPQVSISRLVRSESFPYPSVVSIDVEGSEFEVLRGMEAFMRSDKRPVIFLSLHPEFMFRIYGEYQYDLRNWIKDMGYKETLLDYQHEVHLMYI